MPSKDINIHVKSTGTDTTKQDLKGVANQTEKLGDSTEKMGRKGKKHSALFTSALKKIGTLGVAGIVTALAAASLKIAKFFDNIKQRSDDAVRDLQSVRKGFDDLFEAMSAFDEKSRQAVTVGATGVLKEAGVQKELGLPIINEYTRQFRGHVDSGVLSEDQYNEGLTGMLGYAARHGGDSTSNLIQMMSGWGMVTPGSQGDFRRMISNAAAASGLTDSDVIGALGRGGPTIQAMGWTPQQAVENIAVLASGETGRLKMSLPATTLQALGNPQYKEELKEFGITEEMLDDPQKLLTTLRMQQQIMSSEKFYSVLTDIYGSGGAAGVHKLLTADRGGIQNAVVNAVGPGGIAAEQKEEMQRRTTLEYRDAVTKANNMMDDLRVTTDEQYMEDVRERGKKYKEKVLRRDEPIRQSMREVFTPVNAEDEAAAQRLWWDSLSKEERDALSGAPYPALQYDSWDKMSPRSKYEAVNDVTLQDEGSGATTINTTYNNNLNIYPRIGEDDRGPRVNTDIK